MVSAVILMVFLWMERAHLDAPEATPNPSTKIALIGAPAQPTRQHAVTPSHQPTGTPYAWADATGVRLPQSTPTLIPENAFYIVQEGDTLVSIANLLETSVEALRSMNSLSGEVIMYNGKRLLKPGRLTYVQSSFMTTTISNTFDLTYTETADIWQGRAGMYFPASTYTGAW